MELKACKSGLIAAHGYDAALKRLSVRFHNGQTYHYHGVEPEVAHAMANASSIGGFFSKAVRGKYEHTKEEAPKP